MGDWQSEHEHRFLVHFSDGGAGMREYASPLEVGAEITDGGQRYRVTRVQERETRGGFGHPGPSRGSRTWPAGRGRPYAPSPLMDSPAIDPAVSCVNVRRCRTFDSARPG